MNKSLHASQLEAAVLGYLLEKGQPEDFASIRHGADLVLVARSNLWAAIRSLIEARKVSYAYRIEETTYEGFKQSMSYPVFWVNRDAVAAGGYPLPVIPLSGRPGDGWWPAYLTCLQGKGVPS